MSANTVLLTVLSVNDITVVSHTEQFVVEDMHDIRENMNVVANAKNSSTLILPGESQFVYLTKKASNLSKNYTVDQTLEEIFALINPEEIPN